MLNYLHLKTLYSRRQHLDALYLVNVFKNKINCCTIMDTIGLHIPAKQIRDFSTFRLKNVSILCPSTRCVIAANSICRSLKIFNKNNISLKDTLSMRSWCQLDCFIISYLNLDLCTHLVLACTGHLFLYVVFVHCLCAVHWFCCVCPCWLCKGPMAVESARK
jgi:hypothetical protein